MRATLCAVLPVALHASYCDWTTDKPIPHGNPNLYPINEFAKSSSLVTEIANAKLFNVTVPHDGGNTTSHFPVAHVYGSAAERGTALGTLVKLHLGGPDFVDRLWAYFEQEITDVLPGILPEWFQSLLADMSLGAALDLTFDLTKKWTNPEYTEEMKAMAKAGGFDYKRLRGINMIAGLTQGKCSMFGAWGDALAEKDGLLQLRALDWDDGAEIVNNPLITVFHTPTSTYATVGITGLMGALTGVSDKQMAISEIGVTFPDDTFGKQSRVGVPFIFLLRDILHEDKSLNASINHIESATRTCDLILGVGDGKPGAGDGKGFRSFAYSHSKVTVIDDEHLLPEADWHKPLTNVVYHGMDWVCPGYSQALHDQLKKHHGNISAEVAIRDITAVETSGDLHLAYYDLKNMAMWVSFRRQTWLDGPELGYERQFTRFNLTELFAEEKPSSAVTV